MNKFFQSLKDNLFELAFFAVLIRFLTRDTALNEALVLICLIVTTTYVKNYLQKKLSDQEKVTLNERIDQLERRVNAVSINNGLKKLVVQDEKENTPTRRF